MATAHSTSRSVGSSFPSPYIMQQQTFLGCSIAGFNVTAGFGDTSSQLSVDLAVDSFNISDQTPIGQGHDVYHDGVGEDGAIPGDRFRPPPVGTPVFFNFGRIRATVDEAFKKAFDDYYGTNDAVVPSFDWTPGTNFGNVTGGDKGYYHFVFGGILQAYTQTQSPDGGTLYNVIVTDPREILSNCVLILNNYAGSTANNANLLNIYGFLEHDVLDNALQRSFDNPSVSKKLQADGTGTDVYYGSLGLPTSTAINPAARQAEIYIKSLYTGFPITGTGMSRRTDAGIPYYRVAQAVNYMMGLTVNNPLSESQKQEYVNAGYGGYIYFRGLKYVVDLSGLPTLPYHYRLGYDQLNLLDLIMEICDATNHEVFITLLPVINHSACSVTWQWNNSNTGTPTNMIAGIIKVVTINKSIPPLPGKIREYLDSIPDPVTVKDFGYELTNEPTDKFVTGADEVAMYYFTRYQAPTPVFGMHQINNSLNQQILPYYGTLAPKTVTIPRGFGSYQQITLDAGELLADGVGKYYVATELELRAASISMERWIEFLLMYNDKYYESVEGGDIQDMYYAQVLPGNGQILELSHAYDITVPRCVSPPHPSEDGFVAGTDIPLNPCSPPYGWPLYWQRAKNIGVPMAGSAGFSARAQKQLNNLNSNRKVYGTNSSNSPNQPTYESSMGATIQTTAQASIIAVADKVSRMGLQNVKTIYAFIKKVADECLGKKFLVKIPQRVNKRYNAETIVTNTMNTLGEPTKFIVSGPFGFMPRDPTNSPTWTMPTSIIDTSPFMNENMLNPPEALVLSEPTGYAGALKIGFNRANEEYSFNYYPEPEGGWYYFATGIKPSALLLEPIDNKFLKSDNGRIKPYIRYDHSHIISLSSFSKDSYSQQFIDPIRNAYIPDLSYVMENSNNPTDKLDETAPAFQNVVNIGGTSTTPVNACAFIKVDLDPDFYFAPPIIMASSQLHGNQYNFHRITTEPKDVLEADGCKLVKSYGMRYLYIYPIVTQSPEFQELEQMDLSKCWDYVEQEKPKHVYALITLPERAVPTMTTRFRDGMNMQINAMNLKHYLLLDVVRGMPGLNSAGPTTGGEYRAIDYMYMPSGERGRRIQFAAKEAIKKAYQGLTYDLTNRVNIISPSPIYPDLVALPLRSVERCYGPWLSAYTDFEQIGGKMEFIHDESLAPWNYGGYNLMDKAGRLLAEFGTSASLMNERGGFTIPTAPSGWTLGTYLLNLGPLVTNISTKVDSDGISTTVSMDIYTASFGKMQKQRSDNIKQLNRLKQKITDERNDLIRRNMGKGQKSNVTFAKMINQLQSVESFANRFYSSHEKGHSQVGTMITASVTNSPGSAPNSNGAYQSPNSQQDVHGGMMSNDQMAYAASILASNPVDAGVSESTTGQANITDIFYPYSRSGGDGLPTIKNGQLPNGTQYG